jgi:hypothetical protein
MTTSKSYATKDTRASTAHLRKRAKYNVILVCHKCLKELVVPNEQFDPWDPLKGTDWEGPSLVKRVILRRAGAWDTGEIRYVSTPASDVESYCPNCKEKK